MASYSEVVSRVMAGDYDNASPAERADAVAKVISACSVAAGAVTVQPIPFVDTALIAPEYIEPIAAKVIELLQSPDLGGELQDRVRSRAAAWSGETMARRLLEIYRGLSTAEQPACTTSA